MTKDEALKLLQTAPRGTTPSRVNKNLTMSQVVDVVRNAVKSPQTTDTLDSLTEKRVWQVVKNQRRPRY